MIPAATRYCGGRWFLLDGDRDLATIYRVQPWQWKLGREGLQLLGARYPGPHTGSADTLQAALNHLRANVFTEGMWDDGGWHH